MVPYHKVTDCQQVAQFLQYSYLFYLRPPPEKHFLPPVFRGGSGGMRLFWRAFLKIPSFLPFYSAMTAALSLLSVNMRTLGQDSSRQSRILFYSPNPSGKALSQDFRSGRGRFSGDFSESHTWCRFRKAGF